MSKVLINNETLTGIANAIREKTQTTETMKPGEMADEISKIETGGDDTLGTFLNSTTPGIITAYNTTIPAYSFYNITKWNGRVFSFDFPALKSIGRSAFNGYGSSAPNQISAFIAPNVESIDIEAFSYCSITGLEIDAVKTLGQYAFSYSSINQTTLYLEHLTSAQYGAFYKATGFSTAYIGTENQDSTATDYRGGFMYQNTTLKRVEIKASTIKSESFRYCSNLTTFVIRKESGIITLEDSYVFRDTPIASGTGLIYVPDALVESYKTAANWTLYADQIKPLSELEDA